MYAVILSKPIKEVIILGKPWIEYLKQSLCAVVEKENILEKIQLNEISPEEDLLFIPIDIIIYKNSILKESYKQYKDNGYVTIFQTSTKKNSTIKNDFCFLWGKAKDLLGYTENKDQSLEEFKNLIHPFSCKIDNKVVQRVSNYIELSIYTEQLEEEIQKKWLKKGVFIENPKSVIIGPDVYFSGPALVKSGTQILGQTICYEGVVIGPNCEIIDAVIKDNAHICHSVIQSSIVGKNSKVGPFAHIRNHTTIGEENRIGNFVEMKNTTTGKKTYASHLTYIGDTFCGNGVNFGCGTITVNYDGKLKHSTWIGDNVFIGCNSNLIAPISIDSNSFIASGSTVVKNVGKGDFVIGRAPQILKKNYAKKYGYKRVDEE